MEHRPKWKNYKLLENNIGECLDDLGSGDNFWYKPKAYFLKEIIDKVDFIRIKHFCSVKDNLKRMKISATCLNMKNQGVGGLGGWCSQSPVQVGEWRTG